jgi:ribosomal protein S18 acetylase RimI-like enzyme
MFVLYDLFVTPQARRGGAAASLLQAAVDYAAGQGADQLMLQTAVTNLPAQRLYERAGWVRDNDFYVYGYQLRTGAHFLPAVPAECIQCTNSPAGGERA